MKDAGATLRLQAMTRAGDIITSAAEARKAPSAISAGNVCVEPTMREFCQSEPEVYFSVQRVCVCGLIEQRSAGSHDLLRGCSGSRPAGRSPKRPPSAQHVRAKR